MASMLQGRKVPAKPGLKDVCFCAKILLPGTLHKLQTGTGSPWPRFLSFWTLDRQRLSVSPSFLALWKNTAILGAPEECPKYFKWLCLTYFVCVCVGGGCFFSPGANLSFNIS